jgi:hypothetical protein
MIGNQIALGNQKPFDRVWPSVSVIVRVAHAGGDHLHRRLPLSAKWAEVCDLHYAGREGDFRSLKPCWWENRQVDPQVTLDFQFQSTRWEISVVAREGLEPSTPRL